MVLKKNIFLFYLFLLFANSTLTMEKNFKLKSKKKPSELQAKKNQFAYLPAEIIEMFFNFLLFTSLSERKAIKNYICFAIALASDKNWQIDYRKKNKIGYIIFFSQKFNTNPFYLLRKIKLKIKPEEIKLLRTIVLKTELSNSNLLEDDVFNWISNNQTNKYEKAGYLEGYKKHLFDLVKNTNEDTIIGILSLIEFGIDPNIIDQELVPILMWAVRTEKKNTVEILLKLGADPDLKYSINKSPLMLSAEYGLAEILKLLINANGDVNAPDLDGRTPLFFAVEKNKIEATQILLNSHADPNMRYSGFTALMWAAALGYTQIVKLLLNAGADPKLRYNLKLRKDGLPNQNYNKTALDFAIRNKHRDIIFILTQHMTSKNINSPKCIIC